jgi:phage tail sheath protein FI
VDQIRPIFEEAVTGNGILDYAIKCDEELNTQEAIERHELHCKIGIKPVKTLEWIVLTFICTRQGANVQEEVMR